MSEVMVCPHCGAHVPAPLEADATFATCQHCHFRLPLSVEWVEARQRQQAAIDQRQHEAALREEERRSRTRERLFWGLGFGGFFVLVFGYVLFTLLGTFRENERAREQREAKARAAQAASSARLEALGPALEQLKAAGCAHEVSAPEAAKGPQQSTLTMSDQGDCLRVVAAAEATVSARITAPSGATTEPTGNGLLNFEYCPRESGEHAFALVVPPDSIVAHALLQCPSPFAKHENDPAKNGMAKARARLSALERSGCKRVVLPAKPAMGNRSLTATMEPGALCTVLVASAGAADNLLRVKMTSPMGEVVGAPPPGNDLLLAHCAQVAGDHAITIEPTTRDYYTLAAMDCPRKVALQQATR